ncbi:GtrA family protein [Chryseolinea lacunae]|uniref:GtrA family protein n=1 Tax=Chryseolinea lacunae TaxID=2801331 RepID=A0ABS1KJM5_9BACT|nr:GtrA family protein [Chryseolinea lacunae]MBL0739635.1 GtrA family protein [Chryseolinea lacunae]
MLTFLKSQAASLIASFVDFLCTIVCVELFYIWYGVASVVGNIAGAVTSFIIGRHWVFLSTQASMKHQALRYAIVWAGYVLLGFILLVTVTKYGHINYGIAKVVVAIFLGVTYNYQLQKRYVFK